MEDLIRSAMELNHDLAVINKRDRKWKMSFNPDPTKLAEEILISQKKNQKYIILPYSLMVLR